MSSATATEASRLRIRDFSDRELLAIFADLGGTTAAREMAMRIFGVTEDDDDLNHLARCVTSRLVWMRRYGLVGRDDDGLWHLSEMGEQLRTGRVADSIAVGVDKLAENKALDLANVVGAKLVAVSEIPGRAMQRELVHQINRRRARLRGW